MINVRNTTPKKVDIGVNWLFCRPIANNVARAAALASGTTAAAARKQRLLQSSGTFHQQRPHGGQKRLPADHRLWRDSLQLRKHFVSPSIMMDFNQYIHTAVFKGASSSGNIPRRRNDRALSRLSPVVSRYAPVWPAGKTPRPTIFSSRTYLGYKEDS